MGTLRVKVGADVVAVSDQSLFGLEGRQFAVGVFARVVHVFTLPG